jgi:hypothetical protein
MQVRQLPNDRFVIVFDGMPRIADQPERVAELQRVRGWLLEAGAAVVLYFDYPVDVT